jgi:hypothetical protein
MLRRALVLAILALGLVMAFFYNQAPFDEKHQKRLFVIHVENVSRFLLAVVVRVSPCPCTGAVSNRRGSRPLVHSSIPS